RPAANGLQVRHDHDAPVEDVLPAMEGGPVATLAVESDLVLLTTWLRGQLAALDRGHEQRLGVVLVGHVLAEEHGGGPYRHDHHRDQAPGIEPLSDRDLEVWVRRAGPHG